MIPQPVLMASPSVFLVVLIQSGRRALSHAGPVINASRVPVGVSCSAQNRESASPLEKPQPQPLFCGPINDSDSSATYRPTARFRGLTVVLANVASRYKTPPALKSHP